MWITEYSMVCKASEVKTQTPVLRKNISDYPQRLEIETATNASAKALGTI